MQNEKQTPNIPTEFLKPYNPTEHESTVYQQWEESGYFNPDVCIEKGITRPEAETYTIILPPPNVTGTLHMGGALMLVIEDVLVRHARMSGKKTLWLPGTDSAAIATQARVEKIIQKEEGKSRYDLGREELLRRIDIFVDQNKSSLLNQFRGMGASLDWSRSAYTMDKQRYNAVMVAFVRMFEAGLIYRGNRIVNWDPKGQTVISDDEIVHEEREAKLYTFKYWKDFPISISTTRPETKVGDTAVAVHPDDTRYIKYIGKTYEGEFAGTRLTIRIIADSSVEKDFGTGALGVTPAHSHTDWDISERHNLPHIQVINEKARMTENAGLLVKGLKVLEAREKIITWLRDNNLIESEETIKQNVSTAERTGGIVEPIPKLQWFIDVNKPFTLIYSEINGIPSGAQATLKEIMRKSVEGHQVSIMPDRFERVYFNWINNLRDWCISRQIWFGHRIPVWYRDNELYCGIEAPQDTGWEQDPDVLDTWFSAALWTFSTLGWPEKTSDLEKFHPTTVLETGYDILFFWVARMILMSGFHLGQVPFKFVYMHGLVRDKLGQKISKSLGNNVDPLEMGAKYGTDAIRVSLIAGTAPGMDTKISEEKIKAYKNFANKLWNITRFVLTETEGMDFSAQMTSSDTQILLEAKEMVREVSKHIEMFRLDLAIDVAYHFIWDRFASTIIEESKIILSANEKTERASRQRMLYEVLILSLKTLHPFMPFITESIWQRLPNKTSEMIMISQLNS
jgi:valyl-tRNA synthetase